MRLSLSATMRWLSRSLAPLPPPGCRHQSNPYNGSLAQASVRSKSLGGLTRLLEPSGPHVRIAAPSA